MYLARYKPYQYQLTRALLHWRARLIARLNSTQHSFQKHALYILVVTYPFLSWRGRNRKYFSIVSSRVHCHRWCWNSRRVGESKRLHACRWSSKREERSRKEGEWVDEERSSKRRMKNEAQPRSNMLAHITHVPRAEMLTPQCQTRRVPRRQHMGSFQCDS